MEQPFYIGQKVVAIYSATNNYGFSIEKGKLYFILDLYKCKFGFWKVDVGLHDPLQATTKCPCGHEWQTKQVFCGAFMFAPIADQYADMTAEIAESVKETREAPDKVIAPERNPHVNSLFRDILNQLL